MPSSLPLPTVDELRAAGLAAVRGQVDRLADTREGSLYDVAAGMGAILWSRQAQRDRDMFRGVHTDTAEGERLTELGERRLGVARVLDAYGTGEARLVRPTAAGGEGTFWEGTRILITSSLADAREFAITRDTPVDASATGALVPIRATTPGPEGAANVTSGLALDDSVWDASWRVTELVCGPGTLFEAAADYRARARADRLRGRSGRLPAIVQACNDAGATRVVALGADFFGAAHDAGFNSVYVGDDSYTSSTRLVRACTVALESARAAGYDTQVLGMANGTLEIALTVNLWKAPGALDARAIESVIRDAIASYFRRALNAFLYKRDALAAAILRAVAPFGGAQAVTWAAPVADITRASLAGASQLTRWSPSTVAVTLAGPA